MPRHRPARMQALRGQCPNALSGELIIRSGFKIDHSSPLGLRFPRCLLLKIRQNRVVTFSPALAPARAAVSAAKQIHFPPDKIATAGPPLV